jgi:hypothetical protein
MLLDTHVGVVRAACQDGPDGKATPDSSDGGVQGSKWNFWSSYLLDNRWCVISGNSVQNPFEEMIIMPSYDQLVDTSMKHLEVLRFGRR